ncbi:MAG TPA: hypothetical protein PLD73_14895 [Candidatus Hydrogenedentes bacterium]|nr:hypothetical protein [Candidatus Hydrogenedentota bacterium]HPK00690.1 hypothetical protein [Candidatus Hydrogenedentota bacterium]
MTFTGVKIWSLFIAMGSAMTAASISVWVVYAPASLAVDNPGMIPDEAANEAISILAPGPFPDENTAPLPPGKFEKTAISAQYTPRELPLCDAARYALAYQENRADDVIRMTHWMQECLKRVQRGSDDPNALAAMYEQLRRSILYRTLEGNRLRPEGVEDKYIFAPGTHIELLAGDNREDCAGDELSCPVRERTWLYVTYPDAAGALRDEEGRPIRSIVVGVAVSPDGQIVKAGVLGNVEIDRERIALDWSR